MTDFHASHHTKFHDDPEFQSLLVSCLEALERGEHIDPDALGADYPRYTDEIRRFLGDRQMLQAVATQFSDSRLPRKDLSKYEPTMDSHRQPAKWSLGDTVRYIGEYEILEEIARGGMGIVFKARQAKLRRIVALKMILAGKLADGADIDRFCREAEAAGRLKHPNIVPVHEIGEHEGRHYFTMDFVDGQSLAEMIHEETLAPREAAQLVRKVAEAVDFAHKQGTVHRDLKPANVLVVPDGTPYVTDFGLAKIRDSVDQDSRAELTATGQILGTPSYMSPEQASGKQELVGPGSDIYSLGAVLYACLTGRAPFAADTPVDTLMQVINKDAVSPRELNSSVPKDLETICLKCLSKEPHKRYGTAKSLADDLSRFLDGRPVVARPLGSTRKLLRWANRNRAIASLVATSAVLLVAGTMVSTYFAIQASRRAEAEAKAYARAERALQSEQRASKSAQEERDRAHFQSQRTEVILARSLFDQARAVRLAGGQGHRWETLDLLTKAESISREYRHEDDVRNELNAGVPTRAEVRTETLATLLQYDGRRQQSYPAMYQVVDPTAQYVGLLSIADGVPPVPTLQILPIDGKEAVANLSLGGLGRSVATPEFAISPNGKTVANFFLTEVRLTHIDSGNKVASLKWPGQEADSGRQQPIVALQGHLEFDPSGERLVAFRSHDGTAESVLWNLAAETESDHDADDPAPIVGKLLATADASLFGKPCFSSNGKYLAYPVSDRQVKVINIADDSIECEFEIAEPWSMFGPMAFSPNGEAMAVVAVQENPRASSLVVWDLRKNVETSRILTEQKIWFAPPAISPNGRFLAAGTPDGDIEIYDLDSQQLALRLDHGGAIRDLGWLSNDRLWSTAAGAMKKWELSLRRPIRTLTTASPGDFASMQIGFTRNGKRLITSTGRSKLHIHSWPDAIEERKIDVPMRSAIKLISNADDRQLVIIGTQDPTGSAKALATAGVVPTRVAGLDLVSGEHLFQFSKPGVISAAFADDGAIYLLRKVKSRLMLDDLVTKSEVWARAFETKPGVEPMGTLNLDGSRLAIWMSSLLPRSGKRSLQVLDWITGEVGLSIDDVDGHIVDAQFSRSGDLLLTVHTDNVMSTFGQSTSEVKGTARVRDSRSGSLLLEVKGPQIMSAVLSSDGKALAIQFPDQHVELWNVSSAEKLFDWVLPNASPRFTQQSGLVFSVDGQQLGAINGSDGKVLFLDLFEVQKSFNSVMRSQDSG